MGDEARKHVLVIDDSAIILRTVKQYIQDYYDVGVATGGRIAYKFLESRHTDIILLDYEMPDENGVEVFSKLKANPQTASIPIIFCSGNSDPERVEEVMSMGAAGYLVKPVTQEELLEKLKQLV